MEVWRLLQPAINRIVYMDFSALTSKEQTVLLVWSYPAAINDGGHASFFYNTYGEAAHETVVALNEIGAPEYAAILNRAIDLFPSRIVPREIEQRNDALSRLPKTSDEMLNALDDEFYALGDDKLLEILLVYWNSAT